MAAPINTKNNCVDAPLGVQKKDTQPLLHRRLTFSSLIVFVTVGHLYLPHYKSPTADSHMHHISLESALFFITSTSFCSLSSWFTSSSAYHPITVTIFALTICHSLSISLHIYVRKEHIEYMNNRKTQ